MDAMRNIILLGLRCCPFASPSLEAEIASWWWDMRAYQHLGCLSKGVEM